MSDRPRVVIIGAGFAGLNAAKALKSAPVDVTIIDKRNFHLFQPLLYQVATAALNPADIAQPIRGIFRKQENVRSILWAEAESIDLQAKAVVLDDGQRVPYDYLVVATGAAHSYFGNDQWQDTAPGLKSVEDALLIRRRVLAAFERAERDPEHAEEELTFVVVGAGPTGVELAGAMIEIAVHALAREFDHIDPSTARVVLVEGLDSVLNAYPDDLKESAKHQLEDLGVEVILGNLVTEVDERGVTLSDGTRIDARTVLWAAGVKASELGGRLGVETDKAGRVLVEPDLSLPGHPEVFVAGDLAAIEVDGEPVPGLAPAAIQGGKHAARQIVASVEGRERAPFRYVDRGTLATIGRARAVADMKKFRFSGFFAWLAWLVIHVFFLIGFRNRVFVILQWAWNYLSFRRGARIITEVEPEVGSHVENR